MLVQRVLAAVRSALAGRPRPADPALQTLAELPQDFLAWAQAPVLLPKDFEGQHDVFAHAAVQAFIHDAVRAPAMDPVVRQCAALLPGLHPHKAALVALICGALVENGADPTTAFAPGCTLLAQMLASLAPFCADAPQGVDDEDDPAGGEAALQRHAQAQRRLEALTPSERVQIDGLRSGVDLLVLPLMAMLMRSTDNHRRFCAQTALLDSIEHAWANDTLPFDELHFLHSAAQLAYEDELVVVLPTSGTGMVVRAHGINNVFHAISLLQPVIARHALPLGVVQALRAEPQSNATDSAQFLWLSLIAYENGELKNPLAWAWGEAYLQDLPRKEGKVVLIALETPDRPSRSWSGFRSVLHDAQKPHVELLRFLAPDQVAACLT